MHEAVAHPGLLPALLSGYTLSLIVPMLTRLLRQMTGWFLCCCRWPCLFNF
ncbi:MAG: hypothetical protein R3D55_14730 [Chloroflexota bacterium]